MKKIDAFIVVIFLLLNCTRVPLQYYYGGYERRKTIVISSDVGETIEPEERKNYNLFPDLTGFQSATFYSISGGGYELEISIGTSKWVSVNRDPSAVRLLKDYIERYEMVKESKKEFENEWKIVDYDVLGMPITKYEVNSVKKQFSSCGCGVGCAFLGIVPGVFLGVLIGGCDSEGCENQAAVEYTELASMVISGITGAIIGNKIANDNAIKEIKSARMPRTK